MITIIRKRHHMHHWLRHRRRFWTSSLKSRQNDSYLDHVLHGPKTTGVDIQDSLGCWDPEFEFFRHTSLIFFSKRSFNHRKARNNWIQMRGPCHFSADSTLPLRCQRFTAACSGTFTQKRRSPTFSVAWILGDKVLPTSITT